jgi:hypothetical protein
MILGTVKVAMVAIPAGHEAVEHTGCKMERDACDGRRTLLPIHDLAIVPAMRACHSHRQPLCLCVTPRDRDASPLAFDEVIAPRGKINSHKPGRTRALHITPLPIDRR